MQAGQYATDGTTRWIFIDIRDGSLVGNIIFSPILRKGYVKANGALLQNASVNYPRLVSFAVDNSLTVSDDTAWEANKAAYVYDETNDTLRVPDAGGRVLQGEDVVGSKEAGLPNITGKARIAPNGDNDCPVIGHEGAFEKWSEGNLYSFSHGSATTTRPFGLTINASRSNPIYSASQTVQPPALGQVPQTPY